MSADHKRPLYAFVIVAIMCALIIANALRSQAVMGVLQADAARIIPGVQLHALGQVEQPARTPAEPPVLTASTPVVTTPVVTTPDAQAGAGSGTDTGRAHGTRAHHDGHPQHPQHPQHPDAGPVAPATPGEHPQAQHGSTSPAGPHGPRRVVHGVAHGFHAAAREVGRGLGRQLERAVASVQGARGPSAALASGGQGHGLLAHLSGHGLALGHGVEGLLRVREVGRPAGAHGRAARQAHGSLGDHDGHDARGHHGRRHSHHGRH